MTPGPRLRPLLAQYDHALARLLDRLAGPGVDSGDGERVAVAPLTDDEYRWEPVPGCWSVRPRSAAPGVGATGRVGAGDWLRDGGRPRPWPPPVTTIAWRLSHLVEMLTLRAEWTDGPHARRQDDLVVPGDAASAVAALGEAGAGWRRTLVAAGDAALDRVGLCTYPDSDDAEHPWADVVWWVDQEVLHHGAEIALLRDLYRAGGPGHLDIHPRPAESPQS